MNNPKFSINERVQIRCPEAPFINCDCTFITDQRFHGLDENEFAIGVDSSGRPGELIRPTSGWYYKTSETYRYWIHEYYIYPYPKDIDVGTDIEEFLDRIKTKELEYV